MSAALHALVVFSIDGRQFALNVASVESVHRCVEITPLPGVPAGVRGVINVRGTLMPVFDLRASMGFPQREIRASDHLIIAHTSWRTVALLVDYVSGVVPCRAEALTAAPAILPGITAVSDAVTLGGEIILMHDLDTFLTQEEHADLQLALKL